MEVNGTYDNGDYCILFIATNIYKAAIQNVK